MAWFLRGVQSAIFYYVSCAPCTKYTSHRKRQKQLERDREERERLALQSPNTYRQPSPYRTNEYWAEEIRLGPGPPPKNVSRKQREDRRQARARERDLKGGGQNISGDASRVGMEALDTFKVGAMKERIRHAVPDRWRRHQREDEELWGSDFSPSEETLRTPSPTPKVTWHGPTRRASAGDTSAGFSERDGTSSVHGQVQSRRNRGRGDMKNVHFWTARNPPINDLHPPVVSNPAVNSFGNQWMLQPPPSPAVMGGFQHVGVRSRSVSGAGGSQAKRGVGSAESLAKQLSHRVIEDKIRRSPEYDGEGGDQGTANISSLDSAAHEHATARRIVNSIERDSNVAEAEDRDVPLFGHSPQMHQSDIATAGGKRSKQSRTSSTTPPLALLTSPSSPSKSKGHPSGTPDSGIGIGNAPLDDWQPLNGMASCHHSLSPALEKSLPGGARISARHEQHRRKPKRELRDNAEKVSAYGLTYETSKSTRYNNPAVANAEADTEAGAQEPSHCYSDDEPYDAGTDSEKEHEQDIRSGNYDIAEGDGYRHRYERNKHREFVEVNGGAAAGDSRVRLRSRRKASPPPWTSLRGRHAGNARNHIMRNSDETRAGVEGIGRRWSVDF